jgi:hypothetical protein
VLKLRFGKDLATVSQDERWVAYQSTESGRWDVYVARFPSFLDRRQVSLSGGCQPLWNKDGTELFYLNFDGKLSAVTVKTGTGPETRTTRVLFHRTGPSESDPDRVLRYRGRQEVYFPRSCGSECTTDYSGTELECRAQKNEPRA